MKSVTELIEKECLLLILNVVTSLRCWWSVALYVQTAICYGFVIASIVIVEISTFILSPSDTSVIEKIVSPPLFAFRCQHLVVTCKTNVHDILFLSKVPFPYDTPVVRCYVPSSLRPNHHRYSPLGANIFLL